MSKGLHEIMVPVNSLILTANDTLERCEQLFEDWKKEFKNE
jgi:hypothetical protein